MIISTNKLLDLFLLPSYKAFPSSGNNNNNNNNNHIHRGAAPRTTAPQTSLLPPSFGLRHDPLMLTALIFAALIHDVEHQGIPNRQLALEDDRLAILYNDCSIAENWSLYVAFSEFLQEDYTELRNCLFGGNSSSNVKNKTAPAAAAADTPKDVSTSARKSLSTLSITERTSGPTKPPPREEYLRFRKAVINLVLATDIASPERTQLGKSKWKEAFGDPYETKERKARHRQRKELQQQQLNSKKQHGRQRMASRLQRQDTNGSFDASVSSFASFFSHQTEEPVDSGAIADSEDNESDAANDEESLSVTPENSEVEEDEREAEGGGEEEEKDGEGNDNPKRPVRRISLSNAILREAYSNPEATMVMDEESPGAIKTKMEQSNGPGVHRESPGVDPRRGGIIRSMSSELDYVRTPMRNRRSSGGGGPAGQYQRRWTSMMSPTQRHKLSASSGNGPHFRHKRLGILRTVDLSGETIEAFSRRSSSAADGGTLSRRSSTQGGGSVSGDSSFLSVQSEDLDADEPDELKMTVLMETIMKAADVAHNLQSWEHMVKWSNRLYLELRNAHVQERGPCPETKWFENQIGFLECYLLPLARRLDDTGVFGFPDDEEEEEEGDDTDDEGSKGRLAQKQNSFALIVELNRDQWLVEGYEVSQEIIQRGAEVYPLPGDGD